MDQAVRVGGRPEAAKQEGVHRRRIETGETGGVRSRRKGKPGRDAADRREGFGPSAKGDPFQAIANIGRIDGTAPEGARTTQQNGPGPVFACSRGLR
jgi:hypothetical protein